MTDERRVCDECLGFGYWLVEDSEERVPCRACGDGTAAGEYERTTANFEVVAHTVAEGE
jgi:hypothetical protein